MTKRGKEPSVEESLQKMKKMNVLHDDKVVLENQKQIKQLRKQDLLNYMNYLQDRFPHIFEQIDYTAFMKHIRTKTKLILVDIINYYVDTKHVYTMITTQIKGTKYPELVNVYVSKEVNKVV